MLQADDLAQHQWQNRVVLLFAESAEAPELAQQRKLLADKAGLQDRDLIVKEIIGPSPLRAKFGVKSGFAFVLIGKDGGAKLRSAKPVERERLYGTIDAMPMRRQEQRDRKQ
jgi:hypothetical protein